MAVPKKKMSRSRTRQRKAAWKVSRPSAVACEQCGRPKLPPPPETGAGAVEAAERGVEVVLVGHHAVLEAELAKHHIRLPIVDAPEVIEMGEDPARALREKPVASISVA